MCHNPCPPVCGPDQIPCPTGNDWNGCPMAETCVSGGKLSKKHFFQTSTLYGNEKLYL